eukprot:TRINITY_DN2134_c0_g2_i22.p1 TRINITY_DN2134_c0_g2~~TRINITY_DN2134_c0_g2_i22.p1  ORF type:complete len:398 (-),score=87.92 TRINITY_DN2134_c0_g2_i22:881-2074(-)
MGIATTKGIILWGPSGTGKTLIAKSMIHETGCNFFSINGPEFVSKMRGESEQKLRNIFDEAKNKSPSIIFIDELDSIAPKRNDSGQFEVRIVSQLLLLMDSMKDVECIVLATTNRLDSIDEALLRFGRFECCIEIGVPDMAERLGILKVHTKDMKLSPDVDLSLIASETHGYVGADLSLLCTEAVLSCIKKSFPNSWSLEAEQVGSLLVDNCDFQFALRHTMPSAIREMIISIPTVGWDQVGGLEEIKKEFDEIIMGPIKHPLLYQQLGIPAISGCLLYGPPGCGKTLLAKAIAHEYSANFVSVRELITKHFGDSESNIRELFTKARNLSPCIIFFDDFDSLGKRRGIGSSVSDRIVNQLLVEMDGIEKKNCVFLLAATNNPQEIDPAFLRPGRFDR